MIPGRSIPANHPALIPVAALINDIRHGIGNGQGTNRELAQRLINAFLEMQTAKFTEIDADVEGGQPNGVGAIEPSDFREWFTEERETHRRLKVTMYGHWIEGSVKAARQAQQQVVAAEQLAQAKAAQQQLAVDISAVLTSGEPVTLDDVRRELGIQ